MAATIAFGILAFAAAASLIGALVLAAQQFLFIAKSYRVVGRVAGDWNYRMEGHRMRYYRVEFCLSNGQLAQLRSSVTSPSRHPKVGQAIPVLVREEAGSVKARIGTMMELWFAVSVLLFMGGSSSLVLWLVAHYSRTK
jgi:hypothetical protein